MVSRRCGDLNEPKHLPQADTPRVVQPTDFHSASINPHDREDPALRCSNSGGDVLVWVRAIAEVCGLDAHSALEERIG
jgi:hypothetical protein